MLCSYYKYICDVCILYMCTHVIFTWYKYIIHVMPILHIHTCALYLYHAHTCTDMLHILICTYYIHIKLYIHVHIVHMWVHTPMWGTHFHAYTYSITLL